MATHAAVSARFACVPGEPSQRGGVRELPRREERAHHLALPEPQTRLRRLSRSHVQGRTAATAATDSVALRTGAPRPAVDALQDERPGSRSLPRSAGALDVRPAGRIASARNLGSTPNVAGAAGECMGMDRCDRRPHHDVRRLCTDHRYGRSQAAGRRCGHPRQLRRAHPISAPRARRARNGGADLLPDHRRRYQRSRSDHRGTPTPADEPVAEIPGHLSRASAGPAALHRRRVRLRGGFPRLAAGKQSRKHRRECRRPRRR